jgi:hypothetical protein
VAGGYGLLISEKYNRQYVLGLLNSRLLDWFHHQKATQMRGGWFSYESRFIVDLPIRTIDLSDKQDKAQHDKMVSLVERMLELHKKLPDATGGDKAQIEQLIARTDREIDGLVYRLYDLTDDEIKIVEEAIKR